MNLIIPKFPHAGMNYQLWTKGCFVFIWFKCYNESRNDRHFLWNKLSEFKKEMLKKLLLKTKLISMKDINRNCECCSGFSIVLFKFKIK